jgi:Asp-tRNA(Asn)/Glu-tRNA(Gln) amidotransferase B subunit
MVINDDLTKTVKKVLKENPELVKSYKNGKKGLIGVIMNKIIQESTSSFYTKKSTAELVAELKKQLS